jgi:hypothetical protein
MRAILVQKSRYRSAPLGFGGAPFCIKLLGIRAFYRTIRAAVKRNILTI